MHLNSRLLFQKYALPFFKDNYKVLEVAPSSFPSPYKTIVNNSTITWDTIDFISTEFIDSDAVKNLTYELKSPYSFPIADESYDMVISGQVLEHVEKIWVWLKELKRVTKPGGQIVTINPVSWPFHEAPIDCWRVFPSGINALADDAGLKVEVAKTESVEAGHLQERDAQALLLPERSYGHIYSANMLTYIIKWNKLMRKIPKLKQFCQVPIEVAYDTVSVLTK